MDKALINWNVLSGSFGGYRGVPVVEQDRSVDVRLLSVHNTCAMEHIQCKERPESVFSKREVGPPHKFKWRVHQMSNYEHIGRLCHTRLCEQGGDQLSDQAQCLSQMKQAKYDWDIFSWREFDLRAASSLTQKSFPNEYSVFSFACLQGTSLRHTLGRGRLRRSPGRTVPWALCKYSFVSLVLYWCWMIWQAPAAFAASWRSQVEAQAVTLFFLYVWFPMYGFQKPGSRILSRPV